MPVGDVEPTWMFEHVVTLSKVDATQSITVPKNHDANPRTGKAAMDAAQRLGAEVYEVGLPAFNQPIAMGDDMTACCGDTAPTGDLIVDTVPPPPALSAPGATRVR